MIILMIVFEDVVVHDKKRSTDKKFDYFSNLT